MKKWFLTALLSVGLAGLSQAADPTKCGLGGQITDNKGLAYSSNSTTSWPIFILATTSGTSDCEGLIAANEEVQVKFLAESSEPLREEAAAGTGDHLLAFSQLMGCSQEAGSDFARLSQEQYGNLFPEGADDRQVLGLYRDAIAADTQLSQQCMVN
jgi:hypothetical protein